MDSDFLHMITDLLNSKFKWSYEWKFINRSDNRTYWEENVFLVLVNSSWVWNGFCVLDNWDRFTWEKEIIHLILYVATRIFFTYGWIDFMSIKKYAVEILHFLKTKKVCYLAWKRLYFIPLFYKNWRYKTTLFGKKYN